MKHPEVELLREEILRLGAATGIRLSRSQAEALAVHLALVLDANRSFNLTAIREPLEAARLHVLDSLTALPEVEKAPPGPLADIGSGAGYPGVPLGIVTGRPVVLVESVGKKARFLGGLGRSVACGGGISVENARAEDVGQRRPGSFAVVTARALSSLPSIVELAAPLLQERGVLLAMKGTVLEDELVSGDRVGEYVGLRRVSKRDFSLPEGGEARSIVSYERAGEPRVLLPRQIGLAQRRPLA